MKPHLTEPPAIRWALTGVALAFLSLFLGVPLAAVFVEAFANGAAAYVRTPAVGTHPAFIGGLANLVNAALGREAAVQPGTGQQYCSSWRRCACKVGSRQNP